MESRCTAGPTDRLSTLPVELLEWIFELAYEAEETTTGPICGALLPFDRRERFKHVEVESTDQLCRLVLLLDKLSLHKSVNSLSCAGIEASLAAPKKQEIKSFLQRLSRLKSLSLTSECAPLRRMVFPAFYARVHPSSLTSLALTASVSWAVPWDPSNFPRLATFPTLSRLELHFTALPQYLHSAHPFLHRSPLKIKLPQVKHLVLMSKDLDFPALADLPNACPSLETLTLHDMSIFAVYTALLPSLPPQLTSLNLKSRSCHDQLRRFLNLRVLSVGPFLFDPIIFPTNLAALPCLSSLTFEKGVKLSRTYLAAFISGPTQLAHLKHLGLDLVKAGKRGWRVQKEGNGRLHQEHYLSPEHIAPDWDVPLLSSSVKRSPALPTRTLKSSSASARKNASR